VKSKENDRADIRDSIAEHLEGQAEWRDSKAEEYQDHRNTLAAEAMRATAQYVRSLPTTDPRLVYLDSISLGDDVFMVDGEIDHEEESQLWGRIGFDYDGTPSDHLDGIVEFYKAQGLSRDFVVLLDAARKVERAHRRLCKVAGIPVRAVPFPKLSGAARQLVERFDAERRSHLKVVTKGEG
jgi:hypothetical protein